MSADGSMMAYGATHGRALSLPQVQRTSSTTGLPLQSNIRVLSSDEGGPAPKKARAARGDATSWKDSTTSTEKIRQNTASGIVKARDVFLSMNNISSSGGRDQNNLRRSTRLLNSAGGGKQTHSVKVSTKLDYDALGNQFLFN